MFATPISSPQIIRMLGLRPDAAAGAGAGAPTGAAGAAFWACARALDVSAAAATRVEVPSRILRRLTVRLSVLSGTPSLWLLFFSSLDISTLRSLHDSRNLHVGGLLTTHRNPRWLVEVSIASACRAAGR